MNDTISDNRYMLKYLYASIRVVKEHSKSPKTAFSCSCLLNAQSIAQVLLIRKHAKAYD
jgi:hypothetical protein